LFVCVILFAGELGHERLVLKHVKHIPVLGVAHSLDKLRVPLLGHVLADKLLCLFGGHLGLTAFFRFLGLLGFSLLFDDLIESLSLPHHLLGDLLLSQRLCLL